jgi:arylsulfatase A-like enzyme
MKLLLIDVRGLQAGATGPYGNRWVETFTLNALAAQGVVFDRHLVAHPEPGRARAAWRSGRYQFAPSPGAADLLALLRERGVSTHLLVDASRPTPAEFVAGWDHLGEYADTAATLGAAQELLARLHGEPSWLVWLELAALLPPWQVSAQIVDAYFGNATPEEEEIDEEEEEFIDEEDPLEDEEQHEPLMAPPAGPVDPADDDLYLRVQKSYAAAISEGDILLGRLLDGMPDDVLVVLTADAGQSLGEHGLIGADPISLHAEVVHVPLIFAGAGCRAGRHVGALTAAVDLAPTIAELAGATMPDAHGRSLLRLLEGEEAERPYIAIGGGAELAMWTPERTVIVPAEGEPRLFVKPDDRCEVNDVQQHESDRAEGMARTLRAFVEASERAGPMEVPTLE